MNYQPTTSSKPPHLFSVEPSSLAGRALRAKPEGVGSGCGHCHQRHAQAFSANAWGPLAGTAINATLKAFSANAWGPLAGTAINATLKAFLGAYADAAEAPPQPMRRHLPTTRTPPQPMFGRSDSFAAPRGGC